MAAVLMERLILKSDTWSHFHKVSFNICYRTFVVRYFVGNYYHTHVYKSNIWLIISHGSPLLKCRQLFKHQMNLKSMTCTVF